MLLNSSKLIAKWTAWYSGICWYFANSAAQSAADSGGTMPMTGFHSVIDRPERVSRVKPPTTTIRKINPQQKKSHAATGRSPSFLAAPGVNFEFAVPAIALAKAQPRTTLTSQRECTSLQPQEGKGAGRVRAAYSAAPRRGG